MKYIVVNRYNSPYRRYLPQPDVKSSWLGDITAMLCLVAMFAILFVLAIIK